MMGPTLSGVVTLANNSHDQRQPGDVITFDNQEWKMKLFNNLVKLRLQIGLLGSLVDMHRSLSDTGIALSEC